MPPDSSQSDTEKSLTFRLLEFLAKLSPSERAAALAATLPVAGMREVPALAATLISELSRVESGSLGSPKFLSFRALRARRVSQGSRVVLEALVRNWARLPLVSRQEALAAAGPDLAGALLLLGAGTRAADRLAAARFVLDSADPSLLSMAAGLLGDPDGEIADTAEAALVRAAAILTGHQPPRPPGQWLCPARAASPLDEGGAQARAAVAIAAETFQSHRRTGFLAAAMMLLDPPARAWAARRHDPLVRWLADRDHPANSALRTMLRRSDDPLWRRRAWEWLPADSVAAAAGDRLARAAGPADHEAVLARGHLLANPARRRRLGLISIKDRPATSKAAVPSLLPDAQTVPQLPPAARRRLPAFAAECRISPAGLGRALAPLASDPDPVVRHAVVRVLPVESLASFAADPHPAVARSAMLRADWCGLQEASSPWNPGCERSRVEARQRLAFDRAVFLGELRGRMTRGTPDEQLAAVLLARALGLEQELELELLGLLAGAEEGAVASRRPGRLAATLAAALGAVQSASATQALRACLSHPIDRVRANALESLLRFGSSDLALAHAADAAHRPRGNAVRSLLLARGPGAADHLFSMLRDDRPLHRLAGLWAAQRATAAAPLHADSIPWNDLASGVADLARFDAEPAVRARAARCAAALLARLRTGWQQRAIAVGSSAVAHS